MCRFAEIYSTFFGGNKARTFRKMRRLATLNVSFSPGRSRVSIENRVHLPRNRTEQHGTRLETSTNTENNCIFRHFFRFLAATETISVRFRKSSLPMISGFRNFMVVSIRML